MPRSSSLLHRYMAGLSYAAVYETVLTDYEDLEAQRRYIDSLLASERQTLAALEESFRVRPQDTSTLEALLKDVNVNTDQIAGAHAAVAGILDPAHVALLSNQPDALSAENALQGLTGQLTDAQLEAAYTLLESDYPGIRGVPGMKTVTAAQRLAPVTAEGQALMQAQQALAEREPSGVVGLGRGRDEIARREREPGPEGSTFATEQIAFEAALAALRDGQLSRDDFESETDFAVAKEVYNKAAAAGAYTNEQKKLFSPTFLDQRKRVAEVESQAQDIARPAGVTREQEIIKKQLEARGYDFNKPFVRQQKSPFYGNLVRADELYRAALTAGADATAEGMAQFETPQGVTNVVRPTKDSHRLARDYVIMTREAGKTLDMKTMQRQFRRGLKDPAQASEALSFAMAYNRGLNEQIETPTDAQAQLAALREEERLKKAQVDAAIEAQIRAVDVREAQEVTEAMQAQEVLAERASEAAAQKALEEERAEASKMAAERWHPHPPEMIPSKKELRRQKKYSKRQVRKWKRQQRSPETSPSGDEFFMRRIFGAADVPDLPRPPGTWPRPEDEGVPFGTGLPVAGPIMGQVEAGPDTLRFQSELSKMGTDKLFKIAGGQDIGAAERNLARMELAKRLQGIGMDVTPARIDELTGTAPEEEAVDFDPDAVQPIAPVADELAGDPFLDPTPRTPPAPTPPAIPEKAVGDMTEEELEAFLEANP